MVDYFSIAVTHLLLVLGAWRLLNRADLDRVDVAPGTQLHGVHRKLHAPAGELHPAAPLHTHKHR